MNSTKSEPECEVWALDGADVTYRVTSCDNCATVMGVLMLREALQVSAGAGGLREISRSCSPFYCKPNAALKSKVLKLL